MLFLGYRGEMFDYIVAQKHVPEVQSCIFFHQIIDAVEILHNSFITHRDLKPEVIETIFFRLSDNYYVTISLFLFLFVFLWLMNVI
jgi:serine/threonine protein kinase